MRLHTTIDYDSVQKEKKVVCPANDVCEEERGRMREIVCTCVGSKHACECSRELDTSQSSSYKS